MSSELNEAYGVITHFPKPRKSDGSELSALLDALPPHKCSLSITHNEHKDNRMPVAEWADVGNLWFVSAEDKRKAIEIDEIWTLHWYAETPDNFDTISASNLPALLDAAKSIDVQ